MTTRQRVALSELGYKTVADIQCETARTWAYRAWAARQLCEEAKQRGDWAEFSRLTHDGAEYEHEALEHAALSGIDEMLAEVRRIVGEV